MSTTATAHAIRLSTLSELRALGGELFEAHYEEVALHKRVMVLAPNWSTYEELERAGVLLVLAAFVGGTLVGYSATMIGPHLHYSGLIYAQNDVLFVSREYRNRVLGRDLIYATEQAAAERGAKLMVWHAKQGTALDRLLPHMSYGVQDILYSKEL